MKCLRLSVGLGAFALCATGFAGCGDSDTSGLGNCGNGTIESPEICDGTNLGGSSCLALNAGDGLLGCTADCRYDFSLCYDPPVCGNERKDYGEACDGGDVGMESCESLGLGYGNLACSPDCLALDTSGCHGPICGDGTPQGPEQCDGTDFRGVTCLTLGYDGGELICGEMCFINETACTCNDGGIYCTDSCTNAQVDAAHCGGCGNPCQPSEICVAGGCTDPNAAWALAGNGAVDAAAGAVAHDLATDGAIPLVAYVTDAGPTQQVRVAKLDAGPGWTTLDPSPSTGATTLDAAVALAVSGTTPYVLYSGGPQAPNLHVMTRQASAWQEIGAPGWGSACGMHWSLDLALDGTMPHVVSFGAGGCALGIDYAWWDGNAWQTHPSAASFPAQLTGNGNGLPSLLLTDRAYVGVPDNDIANSQSLHDVRFWDEAGNAWTTLGASLDETPSQGSNEPMALAADAAGNLLAAWAEDQGVQPQTYAVYVKRYSLADQSWSLLGAGKASETRSASAPSIAVIDGVPWLAYAEVGSGGNTLVKVRRFDQGSTAWQTVGPALNQNAAVNAAAPVVVGVNGVPHVAFREGVVGAEQLFVKRIP